MLHTMYLNSNLGLLAAVIHRDGIQFSGKIQIIQIQIVRFFIQEYNSPVLLAVGYSMRPNRMGMIRSSSVLF